MMPFGPIGQPPNKKKPGELIHNIKPLLKELMGRIHEDRHRVFT